LTIWAVSVQHALRTWMARVFLTVVCLTTIAYGSVTPVALNLSAIAFVSIALLSDPLPVGALSTARVRATSIILLGALLGYAAFQASPILGQDFANDAWKSVNEMLGPVRGTISVAPGLTFESLPSLALPFLTFICALVLFQGDGEALFLWRVLAYFGATYAAFGILQETFFPEQLLFETKRYYLGSLTATFVNRNNAGTFFGIAFLLNLGLCFHQLRKIQAGSFTKRIQNFAIGWRDKNGLLLIHVLFCLVVAVALFLTQSRGAVGATFCASVVAVVLLATRQLTADKLQEEFSRWRRYAALAGGVLVIVGLFALFAGRSVYRLEEQGAEDGRWCAFASTIEAIKDNWVWGAGFGAFRDIYPVYRNAECAGIFGYWDRAHNFYLEGYLGLGLPFAIALVIGYAVLAGVLAYGARHRHKFRFIPVTGLAALGLVSLHSMVDFSMQIPGVNVYFATAMAAATAASLGRGGSTRRDVMIAADQSPSLAAAAEASPLPPR
jgi:hypothetical protein